MGKPHMMYAAKAITMTDSISSTPCEHTLMKNRKNVASKLAGDFVRGKQSHERASGGGARCHHCYSVQHCDIVCDIVEQRIKMQRS